jgi:iron complex outermembrane receptor protein
VGYKTARGRSRLELSAFYYDYKNLQVSSYVGTKSNTTNAASSEVYGGEASFAHRLTEALTISGGVAYNHGRYKKYLTAPGNIFDFRTTIPGPDGAPIPNPTLGSIINPPTDVSGNHMQRSPDLTGNIAADYVAQVAGGELALNANVYYTSKVYFDPTNLDKQGGYALLSLRATWTEPSGHLSLSVWGNNVTDKAYRSQVLPNLFSKAVSWGAPATYGVTVTYNY